MSTQLPEDPDEALRQIEADTIRYAVPTGERSFDALSCDPDELERMGIPPRPDPESQPEEFAFWNEMFAQRPTLVESRFSYVLPRPSNVSRAGAGTGRIRQQGSLNWSGAYITPRNGRMLTQVHGSWKVPTVTRPAGAPTTRDYVSSTWIGLDGQRRYRHSTLPQIGTTQMVKAGAGGPTTESWVQWWPRAPVSLGLVVKAGDLIVCSLYVLDPTHVKFLIMNQTTGTLVLPFTWPSPVVGIVPPATLVRAEIPGATAEWIMERPAEWPKPEPFELPAYGKVEFSKCFAVAAKAPFSTGQIRSLGGSRLIQMYEVEEKPHRTAIISRAEQTGTYEVTTTYG